MTTFAIVAGVVGAELSGTIVLVLGAANLLGDGFSMAAGNYTGSKAEAERYERLRRMEERHIRLAPDGEREEVRQIYRAKGFSGAPLDAAVRVITGSRAQWVETMLAEEHGLPKATRSPLKAAASTFGAFVVCGAVPLLPYALGLEASLGVSAAMTAAVFLGIGSLKSRWTDRPWWRSALETLSIGMAAAGIAYAVGHALSGLV